MNDTEFSAERLLEQASGNQSAMFMVSLAYATEMFIAWFTICPTS